MNDRVLWRTWTLLAFASISAAVSTPAQGIPEPDLVVYGVVRNVQDNANLRLGHGTLVWAFRPTGGGPSVMASTTLTNINDEFSYILRIRCETPVAGFNSSSNTLLLTPAGIIYERAQVTWNSNLLTFVQPTQTNTAFGATDRGRIERVDLDVSAPIVIDVNGLPVDWELMYFGRTGVDPFADPDGDGMSNFAEYLAGTNPNDGASGLRITELALSGDILVKWTSAPYKSYAVQRSSNLSVGFADIQVNLTSTPPVNLYRDTNANGLGPYFYRLRLEP
jgi:hypothetical protein